MRWSGKSSGEKLAGIVAPSGVLHLSDGGREGRNYFEEVTDDAVIGDFEDWRILIFIDRDDRLGSLHPDQVLDGAGDSDCDVDLGRDGLAGAADLALHGEPAAIANGARGGKLGAQGVGEFLNNRDIVLLFDAATHGDIQV